MSKQEDSRNAVVDRTVLWVTISVFVALTAMCALFVLSIFFTEELNELNGWLIRAAINLHKLTTAWNQFDIMVLNWIMKKGPVLLLIAILLVLLVYLLRFLYHLVKQAGRK